MEQEPEPPLGGRMFKKILIANRGEIACRVIRTARSMGIATVAVYSDADKDALHVEMADEAVRIGPPPAADSYLVIEAIIEACRSTGAEAVHPGYGFLSENAAFATALADAGITFIGPNVKAIEVMGDKIASKAFAKDAQVNTVPGHPDVIGSDDEAVRVATEIGFPVMLKASAGGGGKGMRIAHSADEVAEGFVSSMNEARSSFGDDRVFIEKFIVEPRHIEIQVMGDRHGNVIHLGERECSIQRRNQKVIEEAPSPFLDEATRAEMGAQAVALAKAVSYESAGTVEFIVDQDRNFYFLEMNTRLQVEHPVTELVTGFDLVELMIRVAAGEPLPIAQDDVTLNGWAIEARIYAEDPYRNFLPSIGRLVRYDPPDEGVADGLTVRNDTGVYEGGAISMFYDPMIAKLCTHAPSRAEATRHMADALDRFTIIGIEHNTPFLTALMNHPRWHEGRLTTGFIAEEYPDGFTGLDADQQTIETICIAAAVMDHISNERRRYISGQMHGPSQFPRERKVAIGQNLVPVSVLGVDSDFDVTVSRLDGELRVAAVSTSWRPGMDCFEAMIDDHVIAVQVRPILNGHRMIHRGVDVVAKVYTAREADLLAKMPVKEAPDTSNQLLCPMPGLVVSISVEVGQKIKAGETLCVVEAMKMENVLRADRDVTVEKINAKPGESLAVDAVIMEFER